jgi:hypothetical protein
MQINNLKDIVIILSITAIVITYFITVRQDGNVLFSVLSLILGYFLGRTIVIYEKKVTKNKSKK